MSDLFHFLRREPKEKKRLAALITCGSKKSQRNLKKSADEPSLPGDLELPMAYMASMISSSKNGMRSYCCQIGVR